MAKLAVLGAALREELERTSTALQVFKLRPREKKNHRAKSYS